MSKEVYTVFAKSNVLAILDGRKWQTRRVIKPQPRRVNEAFDGTWEWKEEGHYFDDLTLADTLRHQCRWQPGDLLCVKEAYRIHSRLRSTQQVFGAYAAGDAQFACTLTDAEWERWAARKFPYRATSARFMYRSLCRIKRPVVWSRAERVQDIGEEDVIAEGVEQEGQHWKCYNPRCGCYGQYTALASFRTLWDSINPKALFDSNVWVWATEFERRIQ